ncbi:MAG TPA: proton-conducting transporter membrane subunit [Gaiellaceae bacterium]|nr:proton-conducting transporter membrane subunit [Gaiellaceae bacterium]
MSATLAVGVAGLAAAVPLAARSPRLSAAICASATGLLGVVGAATAAGAARASVGIGSWLGFGQASLLSDRLTGIFLAACGAIGACVSLALAERPRSRMVAALHAVVLLAACTVLLSTQAFVFLVGWESLTLALYLLGSSDARRPGALAAAYAATGATKLGGASLLAAFGLLYARTGSFELHVWLRDAPELGAARSAVFVLLLVAFGSKLGLVPFQGPLPPLYAAAPGVAPATISLSFLAACYGLWRLVFTVLAPGSLWWGELLVALGAATALVGILSTIAEDRIPCFLGWSSVEHAGVTVLGLGVALVGQAAHLRLLAAAGLLAATLHLLVHGVAKALAFLAAERVVEATGHDTLAPLGGLARGMPWSAACFGLAVVNLAALPPFGGLVSEWLTFMALLQAFRLHDTVAELVLALGGAGLALTAGVGLLAFVKLFGGIFLGRAREATALAGPDRPRLGSGALAAAALALGPIAPWEIRWLGRGLQGILGFDPARSAVSFPLVLGPVYHGFSVLSPTWLAAGIAAFVAAIVPIVRVLRPPVRRGPVWLSGTAVPLAAVQYTPDAYANPIRVVLRGLYGFRRTVGPRRPGEVAVVRTWLVPAFDAYLYRPLAAGALAVAGRARRLQSGSLGAYLLYVLAVLLAALALIPALAR